MYSWCSSYSILTSSSEKYLLLITRQQTIIPIICKVIINITKASMLPVISSTLVVAVVVAVVAAVVATVAVAAA